MASLHSSYTSSQVQLLPEQLQALKLQTNQILTCLNSMTPVLRQLHLQAPSIKRYDGTLETALLPKTAAIHISDGAFQSGIHEYHPHMVSGRGALRFVTPWQLFLAALGRIFGQPLSA